MAYNDVSANLFAVDSRRASTPAIGAQKINVVGQIANLPRQVSNLPYNPDIGFLTVNSLLRTGVCRACLTLRNLPGLLK